MLIALSTEQKRLSRNHCICPFSHGSHHMQHGIIPVSAWCCLSGPGCRVKGQMGRPKITAAKVPAAGLGHPDQVCVSRERALFSYSKNSDTVLHSHASMFEAALLTLSQMWSQCSIQSWPRKKVYYWNWTR